jgi:molecular chaperone GrpE
MSDETLEKEELNEQTAESNEELTTEENTEEAQSTSEQDDSIASEAEDSDIEIEEEPAVRTVPEEKYLRLHAEFDNFRRRTAREKQDIIESANAGLMERLTEVLDNFERAFSDEHKSDDLETFQKGMVLIQGQLQDILKNSGLEVVDPQGELFDPNFHEAFMQQPSDDVEEGHVISVFQKGYTLKGTIVRTAKVIVSSGPAA